MSQKFKRLFSDDDMAWPAHDEVVREYKSGYTLPYAMC